MGDADKPDVAAAPVGAERLHHRLLGAHGRDPGRQEPAAAAAFLIGGGVVYLVVWAYGSLIHLSGGLNFLPFDTADNVLHFGLGVGMIALGVVGSAVSKRSQLAAR